MARRLAIVASGSQALESFATSLVAKATGNAVSASLGEAEPSVPAVAIAATPSNAHTVITASAGANPALYKDVKATFVRAVLRAPADNLALRDLVDVYPAAGVKCDAEIDEVKASFAKTAKEAVTLAKASGTNKVTVMVKEVSKYQNLNSMFNEAVSEAAASQGVAVEEVGSAQIANTLVMAPETLGVVATADTPAAENVEQMYSGLLGGVSRSYVGANGEKVAAGNSPNSVAYAVAESLKSVGLTGEAKKIEAAVAKSKGNDNGASIVAAL